MCCPSESSVCDFLIEWVPTEGASPTHCRCLLSSVLLGMQRQARGTPPSLPPFQGYDSGFSELCFQAPATSSTAPFRAFPIQDLTKKKKTHTKKKRRLRISGPGAGRKADFLRAAIPSPASAPGRAWRCSVPIASAGAQRPPSPPEVRRTNETEAARPKNRN